MGDANHYESPAHIPVMIREVLEGLQPKPGHIFLDGTIGYGGHAQAILEATGGKIQLIGLDRDAAALAETRKRLAVFGKQVMLKNKRFQYFDETLQELQIEAVDGMLLDLGVSSPQLTEGSRGFSFQSDGPLDMRMDDQNPVSAADIVNRFPEKDLADLIYRYGEERLSRRYARAICRARQSQRIAQTKQLADVILRATPGRRTFRIHPATRVFQALRIAVNEELEELSQFLGKFHRFLKPNGRIAILSYHSLEDRLVKRAFRERRKQGDLDVLTAKPLTPDAEEIRQNPRSRSAKLRIAQRRGML